MSEKKDSRIFDPSKEFMSNEEKNKKINFVLGETTGVSMALVIFLIGAASYIVMINGSTQVNSQLLNRNEVEDLQFRKESKARARIIEQNIGGIRSDIGEIKGMLKVLINKENK